MTKTFIKSGDLKLVNGGYLSTGENNTPVTNAEFVAAQKRAEFIVKFAEEAKTKDFEGKKADSLEELKAKITKELNEEQKIEFFATPKKPDTSIQDALTAEALNFMKHGEAVETTKALNDFMQEFKILQEFEQFGLFFDQGIVKLNKIYTVDEIKESLKSVAAHIAKI